MRITALLVSIGLAALSLGASAQAYNWSITDQSPLITYHPLSVGDNSTSWNSSFSGSSWANNADPVSYSSAVGHGRSAHTTDVDGATASVGFVGTAVYVWGQTSQLSALLLVDGVSRSFSGGQDGIIGSAEGLDNKWHDVKLSVRGLDYVQVYGFTFTSDIGSAPVFNSTIDIPLTAASDGLNLTGTWNAQYQTVQDALTGQMSNYTTLTSSTDLSTSITLTPPINTAMMFLYGVVNPYSTDSYSVYLSPEQGITDTAPINRTFNATADWTSGNQVMYQAQLSPGTQYTAKITFGPQSSYLWASIGLASVVYVQSSDSPGHSKLDKGAIAGIVIGSLVVTAVLAFFLFAPSGRRLRRRMFSRDSRDVISRQTSSASRSPGDGGIVPYPVPLTTMRQPDSESSVAKVSLPSLPLSHSPSTEMTPMTDRGNRSSLRTGPAVSSHTTDTSDANRPLVSRQEKEASLAILLPHLASQGDPSASHNASPTTTASQLRSPLRDVDAGPVDSEDMSPLLPPEYQPSWAQQRRDAHR